MVDYTCRDCRKVHHHLKAAREHFGDQLAVVVFPVPLETNCNPYIRSTHHKHVGACKYAKLALSVFRADADKFGAFHDWLMDSQQPPPFEQALQYAKDLVGSDHSLVQAESSQMENYVKFFYAADVQRLPSIIIGDQVMVGVPRRASDVIEMIESKLP